MLPALLFLGLLALANTGGIRDYTGYKVMRVIPHSSSDVKFLSELELNEHNLDFWLSPGEVGVGVEIMVESDGVTGLMRRLLEQGMEPLIVITNMQEVIDWERENHDRIAAENKKKGVGFPLDQYHTTQEIYAWYDELAAANSDVTVKVVGKSVEGQDMKLLEIGDSGKPVQFYDCLIHAREWASGSACLYIIDQLVKNEGDAQDLRSMYDFKFINPVNPDGYDYSWESDRQWKKNRAHNNGSSCIGVDGNRNFDHHHCEEGTSTDPCSPYYCGPSPFSMPETQVIRDEMMKLSNVHMTWSFHSYGQVVAFPYGYTKEHTADYEELYHVAEIAANVISATHDKHYLIANRGLFGLVSGYSSDWYYDVCGVAYAYVVAVRPGPGHGDAGYILDEGEILASSEEMWAGIVAASKAVPPQ